MKFVFSITCLFASLMTLAQAELTNADACYDKKDYACALPGYIAGYNKSLYAADKKFLVEFRIGYCYDQEKKNAIAKSWYLKSISTKSDYGYSWWNLGIRLYMETKYDSAALSYRKAHEYLTSADDKQNMLYWTSWSYRKGLKYQMAIDEYKKISYRTEKYRITDLSIAELYQTLSKNDSALTYALKAKAHIQPSDSLHGSLQYNLGKIYRSLKEYGKAEEAFDLAAASNPKLIGDVEWEKGVLYSTKTEYTKSVEYYYRALPYFKNDTPSTKTLLSNIVWNSRKTTDYKGLIKALNDQLPYTSDKEINYRDISLLQFARLQQPKEAAKTVETALGMLGKGLDSNKYNMKPWRANMLALQGMIYLDAKDSAKALKSFSDAVRYDFSNLTANLRLADTYWNRKKEDEYKKYYLNTSIVTTDTLLNTNADLARAYGRKSHVRYFNYSYKPTDIKMDVELALKYDSLQKEAVYLWAVVLKDHYSLSTYRDRCIALLDRGIKKYNTDKKYMSDLYNAKGVLLDSKKDTAGTRKSFEEGVKIYPDNISLWDNLLKHYTAQNNYPAGLAACDKLIALLKKKNDTKTTAIAFIYKGDFLWRQDKKAEAKKLYAEALVWDSENATAKERAKLQ
jgi:tetratricopeptide (TPR) repeat protein